MSVPERDTRLEPAARRIRIDVLGPLEVRVDGVPVDVPRGAAPRLLCLLSLDSGRVVPDDVLIDSLWVQAPPKSALFSLRNLVGRLRMVLQPEAIERRGTGYRLNADLVGTDHGRFSALVTAAASLTEHQPLHALGMLDEALALVRGSPLAEVADVPRAAAVARQIAEEVSAAVEARGSLRLTLGDVGPDLARFQAAAEAEPLHELRWTQLVDALTRAGRRAEALRAAQRARRELRGVGLSPGPELMAAESRALAVGDHEARWTPGSMLLEQRRSPMLVGRSAEMRALDPLPPLTWVVGTAGLGKTRFLAELAARERDRRVTVLYVSARQHASGHHVVSSLAREFRAADAAETALTPAMQVLVGDDTTAQSWFHPLPAVREGRVRTALIELASRVLTRDDVVLFVDDVDELDNDGARAVLDLVGTPPSRLRVVLASAPPATGPDSVFEGVGQTLPAVTWLELAPLARDALAELVAQADLGPIDARTLDDVSRLSRGTPSLALEAARHLMQPGSLAATATRFDDIVLEELRRCSAAERQVLELLAVVGHAVPVDLVGDVLGFTHDETQRVLETLADARFVESSVGDGWSIHLDLVTSLVLSTLPVGGVLAWRQRVADVLRHRTDLRELLVEQLFGLYADGSSSSDDLGAVVLSAVRSRLGQDDYGTALRIGERYLDLVGLPADGAQGHELLLLVAQAMLARGDVSKGKTLLDLLLTRADASGDPHLQADVVLARGPVETGSALADSIAMRAERLFETLDAADTSRRVQLACWAAHHRINSGQRDAALQLLGQVTVEASQSTVPVWRSLVLAMAAQAELAIDGSPRRARQRVEELRAWYRLTDDEAAEAAVAILDLSLGFLGGTLHDVETARDAVQRAALRLPRADLYWIPSGVDAGLAIARGDIGRAGALIGDAEAIGLQLSVGGAGALAMMQSSLLAHLDGSFGRLAPFLEPRPGTSGKRRDLVALWGLACADNGDLDGARRAAELLKQQPSLLNQLGLVWPIVAMSTAEVAWVARDVELATRLWDELRHWSGHGLSVLGMAYVGAADTWLGVAAALTGRAPSAIALLEAAVAHEERRGATPWRRRAEHLLDAVTSNPM